MTHRLKVFAERVHKLGVSPAINACENTKIMNAVQNVILCSGGEYVSSVDECKRVRRITLEVDGDKGVCVCGMVKTNQKKRGRKARTIGEVQVATIDDGYYLRGCTVLKHTSSLICIWALSLARIDVAVMVLARSMVSCWQPVTTPMRYV